jgi:hypothetical protein
MPEKSTIACQKRKPKETLSHATLKRALAMAKLQIFDLAITLIGSKRQTKDKENCQSILNPNPPNPIKPQKVTSGCLEEV